MEIVQINLMYRDGGNWKDHGCAHFKNKESLTLDEINEAFTNLIDEPIMVQYYGIPSIAPIESEFELASGDDHAFCEITDIELVEMSGQNITKDILDVIELIEKGGDSSIRTAALETTIKLYEDRATELKKQWWEEKVDDKLKAINDGK